MNLKELNKKKNYNILLFFLLIFSIYCALTVGKSWDEDAHITLGKITLNYLFSLGQIDKHNDQREFYATIYWSLKYLFSNILPSKYQIEVSYLINLVFSLSTIVALSKLTKELFNKKVGKIIFLILFFYPIFFGHMAINSKDSILAFCHVWIFYLIIRYLKKQNFKDKANNYIISISVLAALATGIQLVFLGSLFSIFLFLIIEIFLLKKIICVNFNKKRLYADLFKAFIIFYFLLILFWIDTHPNIFILPINFISEFLSSENWKGVPYNLMNGEYFLTYKDDSVPKFYFLTSLIFKSPEYFLLSYIIFFITIITSHNFFKSRFKFFFYKINLILSILIIPILILFIVPFAIYDGVRLFLWSIPYFCIIPALTIYYLIENFNLVKSKLLLSMLSFFMIYLLLNFFSLTPYQYTYLNLLNGKSEKRYKRFENDYWAVSVKELVKNSNFDQNKTAKFATCGVPYGLPKYYFSKKDYINFRFTHPNEADYIIMTNRVSLSDENSIDGDIKLTNCFDKYKGNDIFQVKRGNLLLSVIREIKR